jgi:hypothetical protein
VTPARIAALATLLAALSAFPAQAGVTVETRMDVSMLGGAGGGAGTVEIQGLLRRETRHISFAGAAATAAPTADSDAITRLDKGVQWQLDASDSSYGEVPLSRLGASLTSPGGMALPGLDPSVDAHVSWSVVVTPHKQSARIAGFLARRTDIVLTGTAHDPETGAAMTLRLVTQWWMCTTAPGAAETEAFERGFEKATGGLSPDVPGLLSGLPGARDAVLRLTNARRGLTGVPLRTVLEVRAPGLAAMLGKAMGSLEGGGGEGVAPSATGDATGDATGGADEPLVTSTIEVTAIHAGRIATSRFLPPLGYVRAEGAPREVHE